MKRLSLIILFLAVVALPTAAQTPTNTPSGGTGTPSPVTWCYNFDFRVSDGGWAITNTNAGAYPGVWVSGQGWQHTDVVSSGGSYWRGLAINYNGPDVASYLKSIDIEVTYVQGHHVGSNVTSLTHRPWRVTYTNNTSSLIAVNWDLPTTSYTAHNWVEPTFNQGLIWNNGVIYIRSESGSDVDSDGHDGSTTLHSAQFTGYGVSPFPTSNCGSFAPTPTPSPTPTDVPTTYVKPLTATDMGPWGMVNHEIRDAPPDEEPQQETILAFSDEQGAFVRAGAEGIVTSVTKMTAGDCMHYLYYPHGTAITLPSFCSFSLSDDITSGGYHEYTLDGGLLPIQETGLYEVVIDVQDDENYLHYIVEGAPNFVEEGQTVSAGCYLGRTLTMYGFGLGLSPGGIGVGLSTSPYGAALMTVENPDGTIVDGLDYFTIEPPDSAPCNQAENFEGCTGDTTLADPSAWTINNGEFFPGGGVVVESGGYISTLMNLDSEMLPEMIAYIRGVSLNDFTMQLGETIQTTSIFTFGYEDYDGSFADYTIEADEHLPDSGGMYTVKITNISPLYPIEISYICVRHTDGETLEPPSGETGTCTFMNHNFHSGTTDWDGSIEAVSGGVAVGDTETISQTITLPAGDYYLSGALFLDYVGYTPSPADTDKDLLIEYRFPSSGDYEEALAYTGAQIAQKKNQLQFKVPFTVGSTDTSSFSVSVDLTGFDSSLVYGVVFKSLCIFPTSQEGPLVESCTPIAEPSGDGFGDWTRWVWHQHNQFYMCTLMIVLNNMYEVMVNSFKLAGWVQRYSMAVTQNAMNWTAYQALPWLAGYLSNIQPSQITAPTGCNTIWCLGEALVGGINNAINRLFDAMETIINQIVKPILDILLWMLQAVFLLLYDLIIAIVDLFFLLIGQIVELFLFAKNLLFGLIGAWNNATPQALPGLWDCTDTVDVHPVCWILWMLENTLFAGVAGSAIIPVAVSLGYIVFGIHAIKRIAKTIKEMGNSV